MTYKHTVETDWKECAKPWKRPKQAGHTLVTTNWGKKLPANISLGHGTLP